MSDGERQRHAPAAMHDLPFHTVLKGGIRNRTGITRVAAKYLTNRSCHQSGPTGSRTRVDRLTTCHVSRWHYWTVKCLLGDSNPGYRVESPAYLPTILRKHINLWMGYIRDLNPYLKRHRLACCLYTNVAIAPQPGVEPESTGWQPVMLAITPLGQIQISLEGIEPPTSTL